MVPLHVRFRVHKGLQQMQFWAEGLVLMCSAPALGMHPVSKQMPHKCIWLEMMNSPLKKKEKKNPDFQSFVAVSQIKQRKDYWGMSHGNSYPSFVKSEYAEDWGEGEDISADM